MGARIYLSPPHMSGYEGEYIERAFRQNWVAPLGPNVDEFESELASVCGSSGAVALSSGTAGIHLALSALGVEQGDIVFCSTLTFIASANPIRYLQATPVFIDSEQHSWNMDWVALSRAFAEAERKRKLPKAVIVANLYGQSADMHSLLQVCRDYGVPLVEDAAESLGARYRNLQSGSLGLMGVYSFNGNKIITTSGGGALVSDDLALLDRVRFLATQARDKARHYEHSQVGYNYRLSNVLAGVGLGQLRVLGERVRVRRRIFERYRLGLSGIEGLKFMPEPEWSYSTRWLTALTIDPKVCGTSRDVIIDALDRENIEARPVWKPLHLQPVFSRFDYYTGKDSSVSDSLFDHGLCLPSGSSLTEDEQDRIIDVVRRSVN